MVDGERGQAGAVRLQRHQVERGRLELVDQGAGALAAERVREGGERRGGRLMGAHQGVGRLVLAPPLGQPGEPIAFHSRPLGKAARVAASSLSKRSRSAPEKCARKASRRVSRASSAASGRPAASMPGFEVGQHEGHPLERMAAGASTAPGAAGAGGARQGAQIEAVDLVALARGEAAGVAERLGEEVAQGVAQGAADARRVVVLLEQAGERRHRLGAPRLALLEGGGERRAGWRR